MSKCFNKTLQGHESRSNLQGTQITKSPSSQRCYVLVVAQAHWTQFEGKTRPSAWCYRYQFGQKARKGCRVGSLDTRNLPQTTTTSSLTRLEFFVYSLSMLSVGLRRGATAFKWQKKRTRSPIQHRWMEVILTLCATSSRCRLLAPEYLHHGLSISTL